MDKQNSPLEQITSTQISLNFSSTLENILNEVKSMTLQLTESNNIASNYYYVGPSAFTFDENEEFVQCYKYFLFGPNTKADEYPPTYGEKVLPQGVWKIYKNIQDSSSYTTYELIASNTSSNINIIPTLNWSPSLTITTP